MSNKNNNKNKKKKNKKLDIIINVLLAIVGLFIIFKTSPWGDFYKNNDENILSYNEFIEMVDNDQVSKVKINLQDPTFTVIDKEEKEFITDNPKDKDFKKVLLEKNVQVEEIKAKNMSELVYRLISFLFMGLSVLFLMKTTKVASTKRTSAPISKIPDITFDKIAGNKEAIKDVKVLVDFLKNPKKYVEGGAKMPRGIILYGDPGTGKTLTAKAIAGEAGVPFFSISGSDFIEMFVGVGAKRVRELFSKARKEGRCIIFIDEIDTIGKSRTQNSHSESDQTLNALLTEMDGFEGNEGILVIAATNRLDVLDPALIRPGRFDKHIKIALPDQEERLEILKLHSKNKRLSESISLEEIATQTIGFSGADLEALLNEATVISITDNKEFVDMESVDKAFYQKVLQGHQKPIKDRKNEDMKLIAWHEAGHALVAKLTKVYDVPKVTIIPSTTGAGGVTFTVAKKEGLFTKEDMYHKIWVNYAGRIAEFLLLGDESKVTTGAYNDIQQATKTIQHIITSYGMSDKLGCLNLNMLEIDNEYIISEASELSKKLYNETLELLSENIETLEEIANKLIEKETLNSEELDEIINKNSNSDLDLEKSEPLSVEELDKIINEDSIEEE